MRCRHRTAAALVALVALTCLTGCTARTAVDLTVRSAQTADVEVAVEFTGDAAVVLNKDDAAMDELLETFNDRTGAAAKVTRKDDVVRVRADVDYTALRESSTITGVGQVRLSGTGHDVQAAVDLTAVPDLLAAITAATADQPDAAVVAATMGQTTQLTVTITFPGGVHGQPSLVGASSRAMTRDGDTVTVVRSAADAGEGAVVVTGDPQQPTNWGLLIAGAAIVTVAVAAAVARRRDQADATRR